MKRYTPHTLPCVTPDNYTEMRKDPEGEWVKWNDPLVQAAHELLDALKACDEAMTWELGGEPLDTLMIEARKKARAAIAKARGDING